MKRNEIDIQSIPKTVGSSSVYNTILPITTGDWHQRTLNMLPIKSNNSKYLPHIINGLIIFSGSVIAVFASNVIITYQKEQKVISLLKIRNELSHP